MTHTRYVVLAKISNPVSSLGLFYFAGVSRESTSLLCPLSVCLSTYILYDYYSRSSYYFSFPSSLTSKEKQHPSNNNNNNWKTIKYLIKIPHLGDIRHSFTRCLYISPSCQVVPVYVYESTSSLPFIKSHRSCLRFLLTLFRSISTILHSSTPEVPVPFLKPKKRLPLPFNISYNLSLHYTKSTTKVS